MKKLISRINPFAPWFSFPWNQPQIIIVTPATLEVLPQPICNPPPLPAAPKNPNAEEQLLACQENWNILAETEPIHEEYMTSTFWCDSIQEWLNRINEGKAVLVHVCVWASGGACVFFEYPDPDDLKIGLPAYFKKTWIRPDYNKNTHRRRVYRLDQIGHPVFDLAIVSPEDKNEMKRKQNKYAFFVDESSIKKETDDGGSIVKGKKGARGK